MAAPHARLAKQANASTAAVDVAFTLHSHPGSLRTIYLDFNGYTVAPGDQWVAQGIPAGSYGGFSIDGLGSPGFTPTELDYITQVWTIVAEKYAPFDVDVTTEDPGDAALTRTSSGDTTYGSHVVFTDDQDARGPGGSVCPANGCAGIAYIGVFNVVVPPNPNYKPAWVYTTLNFGGPDQQQTAGQAANSAAHEIGHNLGLDHDSTTSLGDGNYYPGHDNWAPIMGSSNRAVQQFNNANNYPNALTSHLQVDPNTQTLDNNDFDVITKTGLSYRTDNEGGALGAQTSYTQDGVITTDADTDTFTVDRSSCTSDLTATATGIGMGQALDLKLTVNGPGGATASNSPVTGGNPGTPQVPTGMNAQVTVPGAAAGTWSVTVEGVGDATNSYDGFGSVGQYHLTITGCDSIPPAAPGTPTNVAATQIVRSTSATVSWTAPADHGSAPLTGYQITGDFPGAPVTVSNPLATSKQLDGLTPGSTYQVGVKAVNSVGSSSAATTSLPMGTYVPATAPIVTTSVHGTSVDISWTVPTPNTGQADLTGWDLRLFKNGIQTNLYAGLTEATLAKTVSGLTAGSWQARVYPHYTADDTANIQNGSKSFTIVTVPSAPKIGTPASGASGGAVNALARWSAPTSTGGSAITGYRVYAYRLSSTGAVLSTKYSTLLSASSRSYRFTLAAGRYKFRVAAYNAVGKSPYSSYSAIVYAR